MMMRLHSLEILDPTFTVCKVQSLSKVDSEASFLFLGKTDEEISVVCPAGAVPPDVVEAEPGWKAFRVKGKLDFSLIGIISRLTAVLARRKIGVFVISTFNTDYVLVKEKDVKAAADALAKAGFGVSGTSAANPSAANNRPFPCNVR